MEWEFKMASLYVFLAFISWMISFGLVAYAVIVYQKYGKLLPSLAIVLITGIFIYAAFSFQVLSKQV
ncbi:MAG: hypothetical protein DWQ19_11270 [Crenarchaeota archaeon]|nr:MAG: hypothetical protein DWQ19_11270 [Thermoproteota archaeon]